MSSVVASIRVGKAEDGSLCVNVDDLIDFLKTDVKEIFNEKEEILMAENIIMTLLILKNSYDPIESREFLASQILGSNEEF